MVIYGVECKEHFYFIARLFGNLDYVYDWAAKHSEEWKMSPGLTIKKITFDETKYGVKIGYRDGGYTYVEWFHLHSDDTPIVETIGVDMNRVYTIQNRVNKVKRLKKLQD